MKQNRNRLRLVFLILAVIILLTEIFIGIFVHDSFIRPYFGDVLIVILLYCIIRIALPTKHYWLSASVFLFAVAVEITQIFPLCDLLHIENRLMRVLMGTSFSVGDIFAYLAGSLITGTFDYLLWRLGR